MNKNIPGKTPTFERGLPCRRRLILSKDEKLSRLVHQFLIKSTLAKILRGAMFYALLRILKAQRAYQRERG